jgi:hypothetical protein
LYAQFIEKFGGGNAVSSHFVIKTYISPIDPTAISPPEGICSYAGNAQLFGGRPLISRVTDGLSNTIAYAEHYSVNCGGAEYTWVLGNTVMLGPPSPNGITKFRGPLFAHRRAGDVLPVTNSALAESHASVPGLTFQVRPAVAECDPRIAQTPHSGGMLVALADGSVRVLSKGMSEKTFWAAVTPAGRENLGND